MDEATRAQLAIVAAQARELSEALGNSKAERLDGDDHTRHFYNNLLRQAHGLLGDSATRKLLPSGIQPLSGRTMAKSDVMTGAAQLAGALETLLAQEPGRVEELEREKQALEAKVLEAEARAVGIKDDVLHEQCFDLLLQTGKADTAVARACTVLEDRLRTLSGLPKETQGVALASDALKEKNGVLVLSDVHNEQRGFHHICLGLFGFFRNPPSHRLIRDYDLTRGRQVVGFVDALLGLLREAKKRSD